MPYLTGRALRLDSSICDVCNGAVARRRIARSFLIRTDEHLELHVPFEGMRPISTPIRVRHQGPVGPLSRSNNHSGRLADFKSAIAFVE